MTQRSFIERYWFIWKKMVKTLLKMERLLQIFLMILVNTNALKDN